MERAVHPFRPIEGREPRALSGISVDVRRASSSDPLDATAPARAPC